MTLGEVLKDAGYFTAMTGKWHVGQNHGVTPWNRGFERSFNAPAGGFYYTNPKSPLFLNGKALAGTDEMPKDGYTTDLWTDYGIKFIDGRASLPRSRSSFIWLTTRRIFPCKRRPMKSRSFAQIQNGLGQLRAERHARQLEMGLVEKGWGMTPLPNDVKAWEKLSEQEQDRFDHIMAIYAAALAHVDQTIGRLVEALKQREVLDNTLILFMSDNGGNAESGPEGKLEGKDPGTANSTVYVGKSWATLNNTPFRSLQAFQSRRWASRLP